ncbi:MAG: (2Fe-2S)-binding protein [Caldisericia bacterium]|jgi:carbon-monoxide dehydrogenase small subunit|nr:(2Fe-2S)-binding protein [Caldisericia bacterium]
MKKIVVNFKLNGEDIIDEVPVNKTLVEYLRDNLHLTGTKEGCSKGECGACTVIIDGKNYTSCLVLMPEVQNKSVFTIEGLKDKVEFIDYLIDEGAFQCGFCAPGFVVSLYSFLEKRKDITIDEVKEAISGNLCRCTGYKKILDAINKFIKEKRGQNERI